MAQKTTQIMGRACPCLSLHLVSVLQKFTWRKLRNLRKPGWHRTRRSSDAWSGAWQCTLSCKLRPESGAHFFSLRRPRKHLIAPKTPIEGGAQILLVGPVQNQCWKRFLKCAWKTSSKTFAWIQTSEEELPSQKSFHRVDWTWKNREMNKTTDKH